MPATRLAGPVWAPPLAAPAQGGRAPGGASGSAAILAAQAGVEPPCGCLQSPAGLCPCPAEVAAGCIVHGGARERGAVARAPPPGAWPSGAPVGFDAVARLCRHEGGGAAPARVALRRQGPREPGAAGTGFIDADARRALGRALSAKLVDSPWPSPDRAEGDALCAMVLGDVGDRDRRFVDISSAIKRARLWHG